MTITIYPSLAKGEIKAPPSKSYAHRFLIASTLANKESKISNIDLSNDIKATINCLSSLGYEFKYEDNVITVKPTKNISNKFDANESGSTLRFLIPLLLNKTKEFTIKGTKKLFSRGLEEYVSLFDKQGIQYELKEDSLWAKGEFKPGIFNIDASKSSQYVTGLLFLLPTLNGDSELHLGSSISSRPYINLTLYTLEKYGIHVEEKDNIFYIKGNQYYVSLDIEVEGDYSNAAFLDAFNLLGGEVTVTNLNSSSLQGDKLYKEYFTLLKENTPTIDLKDAIDLGPILFALASIYNGATFLNINRLRIKESDRVKDMLTLLDKFNVKYLEEDNRLTIYKSEVETPKEILRPANDHRIVMSMAVLLSKYGGSMDNIEAVNKSYPNFFNDIRKLGIKYEIK